MTVRFLETVNTAFPLRESYIADRHIRPTHFGTTYAIRVVFAAIISYDREGITVYKTHGALITDSHLN